MSDLTPSYDRETGQVVLDGLPAGVAGEARLVPAPGVELAFDRADGRLCGVVVDTGGPDGPVAIGEPAAGVLTQVLGQQGPAAVHRAAIRPGTVRALSPQPGSSGAWSSLSRLDAAQATSPVPVSPFWAAQAAQLAARAGLPARARAQARQAVRGVAEALSRSVPPEALARTALAVADLVAADEPELARKLRERADRAHVAPLEQWLARQPEPPRLSAAAEARCRGAGGEHLPGLQWAFDPALVPGGIFLPGLSPDSDLLVHSGDGADRVEVEALLAPGADDQALSRCQARLVDPATRRVLARGAFIAAGSRARAELLLPFPQGELQGAWVEVVQGEHRPVRSERLRRVRQALRWADAALRAERRPAGLAAQFTGEDWAALAVHAWEHCRRDWECAGDADRAYLAARRLAAADPGARVPEAPSIMAAQIAGQPRIQEPPYLAEVLGG